MSSVRALETGLEVSLPEPIPDVIQLLQRRLATSMWYPDYGTLFPQTGGNQDAVTPLWSP